MLSSGRWRIDQIDLSRGGTASAARSAFRVSHAGRTVVDCYSLAELAMVIDQTPEVPALTDWLSS
ncbi:hypothetical protein [Cryptosporangium sp. NPDC048952]|uniref:hypothetical protein n=1 Tax=Cryptosporangium sp. NPDC048952 TaxID=3363961 RepID=UPI00371A2F0D